MTYSIVARDPSTGEMGVAVQSHWFAAGGTVPFAEAGVGAVATQAEVEESYGPRGLDFMRAGATANEALNELLARDEQADIRQVAMVDAVGNVATHTGARTIPEAGHAAGEDFSCQANMMWNATVWNAMSAAYTSGAGVLSSRLLAALDAAEGEGGDVRGRQAAGILIVGPDRLDEPWRGVRMHLRTDDHEDPLGDLRRLVELQGAYDLMEKAEELDHEGDQAGAAQSLAAALTAAPESDEIRFWGAIALAQAGLIDAAETLLRPTFAAYPGWEELLRRLIAHKQIELTPEVAEQLLALGSGSGG
ncbi:MAG: DUF1028 domain-containing protein [Actinomycetota bacterium]|nr:DUF1028 domain-containing protein [Actinomycetota bacterium]